MPCYRISFAEQEMTEAELGSVRAAARMNVPNGTTAAGQHTLSLGKSTLVKYFMYRIVPLCTLSFLLIYNKSWKGVGWGEQCGKVTLPRCIPTPPSHPSVMKRIKNITHGAI
jgi:hypothetical protein